jgi:hypothetical protein
LQPLAAAATPVDAASLRAQSGETKNQSHKYENANETKEEEEEESRKKTAQCSHTRLGSCIDSRLNYCANFSTHIVIITFNLRLNSQYQIEVEKRLVIFLYLQFVAL